MATINSKTLFLTTSPRTPEKMIPEIGLLVEHFAGCKWNSDTQKQYMDVLRSEQFFNGNGENDPAFSARDRINRAPKSLGFIVLNPVIKLTAAGEQLLSSQRKEDVFLRQMLKFQIPSPYHKTSQKAAKFFVRPYLEILRLVRYMGTLKFDELQIFGMQLTDWHDFDTIVHKIENFREAKIKHKGSYNHFKTEYLHKEIYSIFKDKIEHGDLKTRESKDNSIEKFVITQSNNMRDYADACFRYLRATGLVNVSHIGKSLSIVPERIDEVDYILNNVDRNPVNFKNETAYIEYLGDATAPKLLTDNNEMIISKLQSEFPTLKVNKSLSINDLKDLLAEQLAKRKLEKIADQIVAIKDYRLYDDVQNIFDQIASKKIYDAPLMLEWNTWRAMTMLDGGIIKANLNFDDYGKPLSTAAGNMADIVCDYDDFMVCVEVTMSSGYRQYDMEGESVMRHLGKLKQANGKNCYCLFIAPTINDACISYFYSLYFSNLKMYGGKLTIVPLPLQIFRKMLEDSYKAIYTPDKEHIRQFFETSEILARNCDSEESWYKGVIDKAVNWLV